ncbi:MAG: hypothetical protein APF76_02485 [Desulfitibacter sp. BRH_c19]|nr:MAG: hypothetical protein APF76_02485 [Desulfitibacter sp. BRH_c19]
MKKILLVVLILLLNVSLFGCMTTSLGENEAQPEKQQQTDEINEETVGILVEEFGRKLQTVSLLSPEDILEESMQKNYGDYVSQELLDKWLSDPQNAPGRLTSSPWPERIEILSIEKILEHIYEVNGEIIEITSVEKESDGIAARKSITLVVEKIGDRWLIASANLDDYEDRDQIVYSNSQYGFNFSLPKSWKDYSIVTDKWEGLALGGSQDNEIIETGPTISIRHPQWASENQRQDIPIMVFTLTQWDALQQEEFHIGAAPIGPKELDRNTRFVFALPARYNYSFPTGYEEVEDILNDNPLQPIEENHFNNQ